MHVLDLFNDKDRSFLEGMLNDEADILKFPGKRGVRSIGPKEPTNGEVVKLKTAPKSQTLSSKDLATISDQALDAAYGYGRSVPGPNFGWLANMNSAMFAKRAIDSGVTDIEKISAEIHKGWASAAIGDYKNKLPISPATPHETKLRRLRLAQVPYNELPEKEKEKDRVVARALFKAITGQDLADKPTPPPANDTKFENAEIDEGDVIPMIRDVGLRRLEMWKNDVRRMHPDVAPRLRFVSKDNGLHVSAEVPGLDRSYGVFDMQTLKGQVFDTDADLAEEKTRLDPSCWKGKKIGNPKTKVKGGVRVNNCVPKEGVTEDNTELYGLRVGDTVKATINGVKVQGDIISIFPDAEQVELLLRGGNAGKTVTVDVRDTESMNEQGVAEGVDDYAHIYSPEAIALGKRLVDQYNITSEIDIQLAVEVIDHTLDYFKRTNTPVDLKKIKSEVASSLRASRRGLGHQSVPKFYKKFTEQSVAEGHTEGEATLAKIAAAGDNGWDMIEDGIDGLLGTEAQIILQDMYDDVSREYRLHPDDDFEQIYSRMMDRIENDYGQQGIAEESEKNPHTSALGKALYRDLSKEKKASPAQVQRNKERWAKRQAEREQGVAEASPETTLNLLKGLKSWQVVIRNNYYNGKYADYSGRYYYVLASSPEEAKQVVLDNADAILQDLLTKKSVTGKKILPRSKAVRITADRIGEIKDGTEHGRMSTMGYKRMFSPQGPMMVKLSNGAIADVQGQEQGVAEGKGLNEVSDETLINYLTKVHQDAMKHEADPTKRDPKKASKSVSGFSRAFNKLDARPRMSASDEVKKAQELAPRVSEESFQPMDHKEYLKLADELHAKMMSASQQNDKEEFKRLQAERDALDARAKRGLKENEKEGRPRIRKYTKMRPDGSKAVRYEVLDYRGMRISGQGTEGFDDPKNAKEFYHKNYDKLQGPVEEQVQEEPIREVAGRYWCKNEKRWKNVE